MSSLAYQVNFAQAYGAGSYNNSAYQTGTTGSSNSTGGTLTNTGFDLLLAGTVACVIIFAALAVRFWKRPSKTPSQQA